MLTIINKLHKFAFEMLTSYFSISLAPSVPLGLAVIEKLGISMEIGWNKPEHPNGVIRKYVVVLSRMDGIWRSFIVEPPKEDKHIKFQFIIPDETAEYKITV